MTLEQTLRRTIKGDVLFDAASRGRYSTDASIYQVEPVGVVLPRDETDLALVLDVARDAKAAILPRGAGTSQCGQTVGQAKQILQAAGFTNIQFANGSDQSDTAFVTDQDPDGGNDADPAQTTITLASVGFGGNNGNNNNGGSDGGGFFG